jgi:hypothetical protein
MKRVQSIDIGGQRPLEDRREGGESIASARVELANATHHELWIDVQEMNIDLLAFTGHKRLLGPTGIGGCAKKFSACVEAPRFISMQLLCCLQQLRHFPVHRKGKFLKFQIIYSLPPKALAVVRRFIKIKRFR